MLPADERAARMKTKRVSRETVIAAAAAAGIAIHLLLRLAPAAPGWAGAAPLYAVLLAGGIPSLWAVARRLLEGELGADLLAGIAILTAVLMREPLVGAILVLMLSGGGALEHFASRRASFALDALAKRMPTIAHLKRVSGMADVEVGRVVPGDVLVVFPHEVCPVDGVVSEGRGTMDESYLTGEPFEMSKIPGSSVLSGAVNGERALTVIAGKPAADSRYAGIMRVMEDSERNRPRLRRLGDRLAAGYIPLALFIAGASWFFSHDPVRFLAVLVVATPCPLLIAIPVAVIGAISLAASRGIIIKNPAVLEQIALCRTVVLDKTGTLTAGKPSLTEIVPGPGFEPGEALRLAAALEQYSRHPLAAPILRAATERGLGLPSVEEAGETPGVGLSGRIAGRAVQVAGRKSVDQGKHRLPAPSSGLECLVFVDGAFAAALRFHDAPHPESRPFLSHLPVLHGVEKIKLVSGDRESEVRYLADMVGVREIAAERSPEQKLAIVREETKNARTLFVGDGINDAPALAAATVGIAIGPGDVVSQAAGAVIMTPSISKLDELIHIGGRMRAIALQSAGGGMALSLAGMVLAALGLLTPVEGAVVQEVIDLAAIINALRVAAAPGKLVDF